MTVYVFIYLGFTVWSTVVIFVTVLYFKLRETKDVISSYASLKVRHVQFTKYFFYQECRSRPSSALWKLINFNCGFSSETMEEIMSIKHFSSQNSKLWLWPSCFFNWRFLKITISISFSKVEWFGSNIFNFVL